jgi:hypothetical protein
VFMPASLRARSALHQVCHYLLVQSTAQACFASLHAERYFFVGAIKLLFMERNSFVFCFDKNLLEYTKGHRRFLRLLSNIRSAYHLSFFKSLTSLRWIIDARVLSIHRARAPTVRYTVICFILQP